MAGTPGSPTSACAPRCETSGDGWIGGVLSRISGATPPACSRSVCVLHGLAALSTRAHPGTRLSRTHLHTTFQATLTGLEPATSAVTGRHANRLRYRAISRGDDVPSRASLPLGDFHPYALRVSARYRARRVCPSSHRTPGRLTFPRSRLWLRLGTVTSATSDPGSRSRQRLLLPAIARGLRQGSHLNLRACDRKLRRDKVCDLDLLDLCGLSIVRRRSAPSHSSWSGASRIRQPTDCPAPEHDFFPMHEGYAGFEPASSDWKSEVLGRCTNIPCCEVARIAGDPHRTAQLLDVHGLPPERRQGVIPAFPSLAGGYLAMPSWCTPRGSNPGPTD